MPTTLRDVYRITVFVPPDHLEQLLQSFTAVAPLRFGDYDQVVWFSAPGIEQFRPLPGSSPTLGKAMERTRHPSVKVEFSIERDGALLSKLIEEGTGPTHQTPKTVLRAVRSGYVPYILLND